MAKKKIITGQKISRGKRIRARKLRDTMTPAEHRLWEQLRANRLEGWHFRRQQIINGFIVDFYCLKAGLVIEVDGPIHHDQKMADTERTEFLSAQELGVIRFTNHEIFNNLPRVLDTILLSLKTDPPFL